MISPGQLRYAIRGLLKSPGFAVTSILTLALGIGITTAIFSVMDGVLLKSPPYTQPNHLCLLWKTIPRKNLDHDWTSYPTYQDWRRDARSFDDLAAFLRPDGSIVNLTASGSVEQIQSAKVSANFFTVLGTRAFLGQTFSDADVAHDAHIAILSYQMWRQRFASAGVLGKKLEIDNVWFEIMGVMPPDFAFPARESQAWSAPKDTQLWIPINSDSRWATFQKVRFADAFGVIGRLKANTTPPLAQDEMSVVARQLAHDHPDTDLGLGIHVVPLSLYLVGSRIRLTLELFFAAVIFVLLIACSNVAGLFFSRTLRRRKSLAIQIALGAGRHQILLQVLAEALVVAVASGTLGLALAGMGVKALVLVAPVSLPGLQNVGLNGYVLLFTLAVSLLSGVLSAIIPALKVAHADPNDALHDKSEATRHSNRTQSVLVFLECTLAIVLLTATGLLLRSSIRLQQVDLGFRPDHLISMGLVLHGHKYDDDAQIRAFVDESLRRVDALPGVKSSAFGSVFLGRVPNSQLIVEDRPAASSVIDDLPATWTFVSEDFFTALGIPLLRGRLFTPADGPATGSVVILSQTMARKLWPGQDPLGKRFKYDVPGSVAKDWLTVVGVAGDTVQNGAETRPISVIYYPVRQKVWDHLTLMVRTYSDPSALQAAIEDQIHQIDPAIPRVQPSTVQQQLWELGSQRRFQTDLFGLFSFLAMVLAGVGMYAVMSCAVSQRTREIGIRMALGARWSQVLVTVLGQGLLPIALGLIAGLAIELVFGRVLAGLLYGVSSTDPITYLCVCVVLFIIAAVAAYVPLRRAIKVDPVVALRYE
jgi:putative ABC transport system permease protein